MNTAVDKIFAAEVETEADNDSVIDWLAWINLGGGIHQYDGKQKPPALVYHYTNDAGLAGIIESGQLRFSDIFAQNDPSELRHGLSVAIDILKLRATAARLEIGTFASMAAGDFFICCFSDDGDDLGQWRAYADNTVASPSSTRPRPMAPPIRKCWVKR